MLDIQKALAVFKDLNIFFKMPLTNEVIPFQKKLRADFGEINKNTTYNAIINNVLLGVFDVKGDKLFQDFTTIMSKDPNAIDAVFANKRDLLFDHRKFNDEFRVGEIALISNIDIFQQIAIKHALAGDVVIEGPPGTGKSETILNILANIALNGKTALFVSEKSTAMDVVYNRLGRLRHVALYVPNLVEDKKRFYQQFVDYENYFEKEYKPELLDFPRTRFDAGMIDSGFAKANRIWDIYGMRISSGKNEYALFDMLLNFHVHDVKNIQIADPSEFDAWIQKYSDYQWIVRHNEYLGLEEEVLRKWRLDDFVRLADVYASLPADRRDRTMEYVVHQFLKQKTIEAPKVVNPFFKPKKNERETYAALKACVKRYLGLKEYASKSKAAIIQWVIANNVARESAKYFYSWYMQTQSANHLKDLLFCQTDVDRYTARFDQETQNFIRGCKAELHALIVRKFYEIYQTDKTGLLEICRHGRIAQSALKDITWWFGMYASSLKRLYPIHIMSFETASVLLENQKNLYDYVVIDEASQVFLERALPALYRAGKYIVAGDTKQLRPSSFFQARANYDDDSFEELDSESIIETNEAVNAVSLIHFLKERARISTMLKYHYRSDFSSLIAFTNSHIYGNELIFMDRAIKPGQTFVVHQVANGKWAANRNVEEAAQLVRRVQEISRTPDYQKTLGIITFNKTQAELIETMLDKLNDPLVNEWRERCNEDDEYIGLFVKNVENVQGDERDIVLFSLGYDKTVSNYGPISKAEGENRLNVAITRAKSRIELFKTNYASEYNGWSSKIPGTRLLVEYLDYCEKQHLIGDETANSTNVVTASLQHLDQVEDNANKEFVVRSISKYLRQVFGKYFEINQNVVEGQYLFDFVFYRDSVPVLAIDVDIPRFRSVSHFYEAFVYKNIFMHKRGWNHFRIWTSEWIISMKNVLVALQQRLSAVCRPGK